MNRLLALVIALVLGAAGSATRAQEQVVVVELFTSQGCSSCPAADEILVQLGQREDIIALALHVDYWDYIGWKDKFAHSAFTARQKGYARAFGNRSIYTPQMVVNGAREVVGNRPMEVMDMVQQASRKGAVTPLSLSRSGSSLKIAAPARRGMQNSDVILVRYIPRETVSIPRGENAGKSLTYSHIVTEWTDIGDWNGAGPLSQTVSVDGSAPIVVLVQVKNQGPILAAARLR